VSCLSFVVIWLWFEEGIGLMTLGRMCVYGDIFEITVEQRDDIAQHLHRTVSPLLEKETSEEKREKALKKVSLPFPFLLFMLKTIANKFRVWRSPRENPSRGVLWNSFVLGRRRPEVKLHLRLIARRRRWIFEFGAGRRS
jgi:hypothetical protein